MKQDAKETLARSICFDIKPKYITDKYLCTAELARNLDL